MTTYPAMNQQIIGLLRLHDNPACLYAADRIEELEQQVAKAREIIEVLQARLPDDQYYPAQQWVENNK